jgi:hypothetical protein
MPAATCGASDASGYRVQRQDRGRRGGSDRPCAPESPPRFRGLGTPVLEYRQPFSTVGKGECQTASEAFSGETTPADADAVSSSCPVELTAALAPESGGWPPLRVPVPGSVADLRHVRTSASPSLVLLCYKSRYPTNDFSGPRQRMWLTWPHEAAAAGLERSFAAI